jgi:RNA polymerase sigma factor (sigma-70 family)
MRSRQTALETFSTFLQFADDRPSTWAIDARLRRSMQHCLGQSPQPELSNHFWALYWYQCWHTEDSEPIPVSPLAANHLSAYLQEACFWAAQKILNSFATPQFTLSDCFQIGIAQVAKVLQGFNAKQGFSLQNYASAVFASGIRDTLRQRREVDICTNWALLRKTSQKRLEESLRARGLGDGAVAQHILAWTCFKTLYIPTQATATRQLPKPDAETLAEIAHLYQTELNKLELNPLTSTPRSPGNAQRVPLTPDLIEKWLTTCAQAARVYLNPTLLSMNTPKAGQETGELLDDIPESSRPSLLADLIAQEETQERIDQQTQLNTALITAIAQFDPPTQTLIRMYYGQNLTQQEMAQRLDMKQYTVSRRLTRARDQMLTALVRWSQETLHISLNSDLLNYTSTILEDWLQRHFGEESVPD